MLFAAGSIWAPIARRVDQQPAVRIGAELGIRRGRPGVLARERRRQHQAGIRRGGWRARGRSALLCLVSLWRRRGAVLRGVPGHDRVCRQRDPALPVLPAVRRMVVPALRPAGGTRCCCCCAPTPLPGPPGARTRRSPSPWRCSCSSPARTRFASSRSATCWERATAKSVTPKRRCTSESALPADAVIIDDAAQRQHPLLHRDVDRAVGQA